MQMKEKRERRERRRNMLIYTIVLVAILTFYFMFFNRKPTLALVLFVGMVIIAGIEEKLEEIEAKESIMYEIDKLIEQYKKEDKILKNFKREIKKFLKCQEALESLIILNGKNKISSFNEYNDKTEQFLRFKLKQLTKCLIILDVDGHRSENCETVNNIQKILKEVREMIDTYTSFLYEISKMEDTFDINTPELEEVVKELKSIREKKEEIDERLKEVSNSEVELFVIKE